MSKILLSLFLTVLSHQAYADVMEDYGFDMDREELREQGFRSKIENGTERFEKQSKESTQLLVHNRSQQIIVGRVQSPKEEHLQLTQYNPDGEKALSRTSCIKKGAAPFHCNTQTHKLCRSFQYNLDKGVSAGADKLKECDKILQGMERDLKGVEEAQARHRGALAKTLGIKEADLRFTTPTQLPRLNEVLKELSLCSELDNTLIGSKWEFDDPPRKSRSKSKENSNEGVQ